MEGAVRSGRRAASMLIRSMNGADPSVVGDLRKNVVIRLLVGS